MPRRLFFVHPHAHPVAFSAMNSTPAGSRVATIYSKPPEPLGVEPEALNVSGCCPCTDELRGHWQSVHMHVVSRMPR
jgi:hypothetical protein